jgi:hypothetical protein
VDLAADCSLVRRGFAGQESAPPGTPEFRILQQPPYPPATALSLQLPSPCCHPERPRISCCTALIGDPDVVLFKENHTQLTEAATLDRKSGEGEGSAVRHPCAPPLPVHNPHQIIDRILMGDRGRLHSVQAELQASLMLPTKGSCPSVTDHLSSPITCHRSPSSPITSSRSLALLYGLPISLISCAYTCQQTH